MIRPQKDDIAVSSYTTFFEFIHNYFNNIAPTSLQFLFILPGARQRVLGESILGLAYRRVKGAPAVESLRVRAFQSLSLWMGIKGLRSVARAKLGHIVPAGALL